ncbi:hypothetical protein V7654_07940 [Bacillus sp. JJ1609]|uniref:hypothetical protein n=1 Tax=Bacillus sp. JJ1609 TaxID=3122977 RepID=UPI002FFEBC85
MKYQMQKANLLAENIRVFIKFVNKTLDNKNNPQSYSNRIYQLKLWIEDFKFQSLADELSRVNQVTCDEKYTRLLVGRFRKGIMIIDEYVERNYEDLYIFTAKLYTLKNISITFFYEENADMGNGKSKLNHTKNE